MSLINYFEVVVLAVSACTQPVFLDRYMLQGNRENETEKTDCNNNNIHNLI